MDKKLLLIEDEKFIRDLYARQLTLAGFTIDASATGEDGIAKALKNPYDLILLDVMLPDTDGLAILKTIRGDQSLNKNTPVIMITNLGQDAVIKEAFSLGIAGYLIKTLFTPNQIVEEVKKTLFPQDTKASDTSVS